MKLKIENNNIALITSIRLLLWWGAEAAKNLFVVRKPSAQIQQAHSSSTEFPLSCWTLSRRSVYCLAGREGKPDVVIHHTGTLSNN